MLIVNSKNTKFETILLFYSNLPPPNDGRMAPKITMGARFFEEQTFSHVRQTTLC